MKLQKLTSLSLAAFTLTALANTASAYTAEDSLPYTSQFYLGSKVGVSFMDLSTDCWVDTSCSIDSEATFTVNPFIGMKYNWSNNLGSRFEVEGFYLRKAVEYFPLYNQAVEPYLFFHHQGLLQQNRLSCLRR